MVKIPLIIDSGYCDGWGAWEGVRELVSNAKDAEELDPRHAMEIKHSKKTSTLVIRTRDVIVDPATLLVLGKSSKRGREVRGRFGEGFVIGCLALTRAGHPVSFRNADLSWRCLFENADADHPLAGNELLTFYSRTITPTQDFELSVENVTEEVWDAMRPLFLFMTPPPKEDIVKVDQGSLILTPERRGMVFVRGVFVRRFDNLHCAYDLREVQLDRDRQMINEWQLSSTLSDLWASVLSGRKDAQHAQESLAQRAYDMVKENADEARHFRYRTDDRLVNHMKAQFVAEHGEDTVPVTTMDEAKAIEDLGAKPVVVNSTMKELLAKTGLSAEGAKTALESKIAARLLPSQLSDAERAALDVVNVLARGYAVVEFRGQAACRMIDEDKLLAIDRRVLALPPSDILRKVAQAEAKRKDVEASVVLADALASLLNKGPARDRHALETAIARGLKAANEVEPIKSMERSLLVSYVADFVERIEASTPNAPASLLPHGSFDRAKAGGDPGTREGFGACDECGNDIPDVEPFTVNSYHKDDCSLYPHADAPEAKAE